MGDFAAAFTDPAFIEPLRGRMVRFAQLHLRDSAMAEDAVQEALLGAHRNATSFAGRSAFATWVFGILKNKIADALRARIQDRSGKSRNQAMAESGELLDEESSPQFFDARGRWQEKDRPATWGDPHRALEDAQFWRVFEACLDRLPESQARVFMMRQMLDLDSQEICETAGVSLSNLHVLLHRARLRLRACLDADWFRKGPKRANV